MNKNSNSAESKSQQPPFVPRSVLMAYESESTKTKEKKNKSSKKGEKSLEGSREFLLKSIAGFLESQGFKKTLDMFISESQIEENSWKSSAVDLDDVFSRFFDSSNDREADAIQCEKPQDNEKETENKKRKSSNGNADYSEALNIEKSTPVEEVELEEAKKEKKEKKKKKKSDEEADKNPDVQKSTSVEAKTEESNEEIKEAKNDKKKSKKQKEKLDNTVEDLKSSNDESKDEKKKKKKKKEVKELSEIDEKEEKKEEINHEMDKEKSTIEQQKGENGEKMVSKKRKKPHAEENDCEEKKEEENDIDAPVIENGNKEPTSGKKDKSSDEPKSANAFKRVKIDEVKFADDRLQDNSYWAKHGADSGYGAKAQQILEQVRGRDFRHEKTKKKRGSYRGGQIDSESHSIKFNYSDEE